MFDLPADRERALTAMCRDFLWEGKKLRVSHKVCVMPKKSGGLGLVDVANKVRSLKLAFLDKLLSKNARWAQVGRALIVSGHFLCCRTCRR